MNDRMLRLARYAGASVLTVLAACAGKYDVGDSPSTDNVAGAPESTGGSSTDAGTGGKSTGSGGKSTGSGGNSTGSGGTAAASGGSDPGSGGSSTESGGGPNGSGGTSTDVGGTGTGAVGGSTPGGFGGVGGIPFVEPTPIGCAEDAVALSYGTPTDPRTAWQRLELLLNGAIPGGALANLPDEVTPEWAASYVSDWLASARMTDSLTTGGFARFTNGWLEVGDDGGDASVTAAVAGGVMLREGSTFGDLIAPEGEATLFEDPALNRLRPSISGRGAWIQRAVQCIDTSTPVDIGTPLSVPDGMTRRDALLEATNGASCKGCHVYIDPPGFALEGIDPVTGEQRATDNGLPLDTSGTLQSQWEEPFDFTSIRDLAPHFVDSCEVSQCFVRKFADDATTAAELPPITDQELSYVIHAYVDSGRSFEALLQALAQTPTFLE